MTSTAPTRRDPTPIPPRAGWRPGFWPAVLAGLVAVGLTLGVAELLAALGTWLTVVGVPASPLNSLGEAFIDLTPGWLKEFATRTFGLYDKVALRAGMALTLIVVAGLVGVLARRSRRAALGVTGLLVLVSLVAIFTRAGSTALDGVPVLIGAAAGGRLLWRVFAPVESWSGDGTGGPAIGHVAEPDALRSDARRANATEAGGAGSGAGRSGGRAQIPKVVHRRGVDRRLFLRFTGWSAAAAAVSAVLTRLVPSSAEVQASRERAAAELGLAPAPATTAGATGAGGAGATAAVTGSGGTSAAGAPSAAGSAAARLVVPAGADLHVNGLTPFVTPNADFYRIDTALTPPRLTAEQWSLRVHGLVDREVRLSYADLTRRPQIERAVTLTCVSNEIGGDLAGNAVWLGSRIDDLLKEAGPQSGADCVLCTSVDGFTSTTPLDALTDGRDALLAVAMNGEPLPLEHGFPVRMVVPGLYGYVSATKWVVDLEVTRFDKVSAYWTQRGWSDHGPVKTASRIDVPKDGSQFATGHAVTVAGMAWAQHRGISRVEVQVDDGPWQPADLSEAFSKDTWRQWRLTWTATAGRHTVRVRATDGTGAVQDATVRDVIPDGATGDHSIDLTVG